MKRELKKKSVYVAPSLSRMTIEMEEGVASGSARISPPSNLGEVKDEWDTGTDREKNFNW